MRKVYRTGLTQTGHGLVAIFQVGTETGEDIRCAVLERMENQYIGTVILQLLGDDKSVLVISSAHRKKRIL